MKKILLISTGGTIASLPSDQGLKPGISSQELLAYLTIDPRLIQLDTLNLLNKDSTDILVEDWLAMKETIQAHYQAYDGFVLSHGTDTLAYTASALSYLIQDSPKPIVLTGAQKSISLDITDAKTNLRDAISYAAYEEASDVSVVFNSRVIAGTRARKVRSKSFDAFASLSYPSLGTIMEDQIVDFVENRPAKGPVRFYDALDPSVMLLKIIPGLNPGVIRWIFDQHACIIIESFGSGGIPLSLYEEFTRCLQEDKLVIMTTQVAEEGSDIRVYEVGQRIAAHPNILDAKDMTLESIVTKAMWALAQAGGQRQAFRDLFYQKINYDLLKVQPIQG